MGRVHELYQEACRIRQEFGLWAVRMEIGSTIRILLRDDEGAEAREFEIPKDGQGDDREYQEVIAQMRALKKAC